MQPIGSTLALDTWYFSVTNSYAPLTMCPIIASNVVQTSGTSSPTYPGLTYDDTDFHVSVIDTHTLASFPLYAYVLWEGGADRWLSMTLEVICGPTSTDTTISGTIDSPQIFEVTETQTGGGDILFSVPKSLFASTNPDCPVSNFSTSLSTTTTGRYNYPYTNHGVQPFMYDSLMTGVSTYSNATHWNRKVRW